MAAAAKTFSAVVTAAIGFAARSKPTPGEARADRNGDPIEWNEQLVEGRRGHFDVMNEGEGANSNDPDSYELANTSSVDHELALVGWVRKGT